MDFSQLQYFPLALPHFSLLIVIFLVLVAWIEVQALRVAYMSIGLGPRAALLLLLASLGGSYLNIPVAQLAGHQIVSGQDVLFFSMRHVIPVVVEWPDTIVAVNVGGAVIPGLLSLYLLVRYRLWVRGLVAVAGVAVVCHMLAEPVRGLGIALRAAGVDGGRRIAAVTPAGGAACLHRRQSRHADRCRPPQSRQGARAGAPVAS